MKLAQFKTTSSDESRLGIAFGNALCDLAELARAVKAAGGQPANWLLDVSNSASVISRGETALGEIDALVSDTHEPQALASVSAFPFDAVEFLPPVYPSKIQRHQMGML